MNEVSKETILEQCNEWASLHLGVLFEWREYQKETVIDIIYNIINKQENTSKTNDIDDKYIYNKLNQIVQAPTGSGKSIMMIVIAGVLSEYYNKECYILCSDLSLYKQYEDFVNNNKLNGIIGCIKGITGNYTCKLESTPTKHVDLFNAKCRQKRIGWGRLMNSEQARSAGFPCANSCKYIKERKNCINKKIIITTYQNYIQQTSGDKDTSFNNHDIMLMDECHNIPNIIQMIFSSTISENQLKTFSSIYKFISENRNVGWTDENGNNTGFSDLIVLKENNSDSEYYNKKIEQYIKELYQCSIYNKTNKEHIFNIIKEYNDKILSGYTEAINLIESYITYLYKLDDTLTIIEKDIQTIYNICNQYKRFISEPLNEFIDIIDNTGTDYIVKKNIEYKTEINNTETNVMGIQLQCVKESTLCDKYLLSTAQHCVLMSATIGNKNVYIENISDNPNKFIYTEVPSTFDFTNSPIYAYSNFKLSYSNKQALLPSMLKTVINIIDAFSGLHGVIQTANYEIMNYIYNNIDSKHKKRLFIYNDSKEKSEIIEQYKNTLNGILIGPSIYEGIDFPDEMCRFIIIMKMPYPSLGDEFTKAKMNIYKGWYESHTSNIIIQGIGRGVRNKTDWCRTFILDGNFIRLYNTTKSQYPKELQQRIQIL